MQKFTQKKIALAVGAALLATAGAANAAIGVPAYRAAVPVLISATGVVNDTNTRALLSTTGLSGQTVTLSVNLISGDVTAGITGDIQAVTTGTPAAVIASPVDLAVNNATLADNNVLVYTGTLAAATKLAVTSAALTYDGTGTSGTASIAVVLTAPAAPAAYRVNAGNLEFTSNNGTTGGTAVAFAPVKIDVQAAAAVGAGGAGTTGRIIYTEEGTAAGFIAANDFELTGTPITVAGLIKNSLAPTPKIATTSAAGGALINGFSIDTGTPITLAAANLAVAVDSAGSTGMTGATAYPAAAMGAPSCAASKCTVTFPNLGAAATSADFNNSGAVDATDAALYISDHFNTGVNLTTVPFSVDGTATQASYSEVFNVSDGVASKLAANGGAGAGVAATFPVPGGTIADGATAAVTKAVFSAPVAGVSSLSLTFSEDMTLLAGTGTLREITENVLIGANSLAALNLNAGGTLALVGPVLANGQDTLTISGVQATDLVGTVNVNTGITLKEPNDTGYSATVPAIDSVGQLDATLSLAGVELAGGIFAATAPSTLTAEAPSVTALAMTQSATTIAFGTDTTAQAFTSATDATKVDTVVVTFAAGKEVALNAAPAKTLADLAADMVITVTGTAGQTPIVFQFHPTAAQLALNATGSALTITLPTALIYANVDAVATMKVEYRNATNNTTNSSVLVNKNASGAAAAGSIIVSTASNEPVTLPLSATAASNTLITQSIIGTLTPAAGVVVNGSRVKGYLAKWVDAPKANAAVAQIQSGKITNVGDKVATDLAIEFASANDQGGAAGVGALESLIATEMNAVAAAKAAVPGVSDAAKAVAAANIPVYVKLVRSNDTQATTAANNANGGTGTQNYLNARAILATTYGAAQAAGGSGDSLDPVYEVMLNPITGAITGRLTGNIVIKNTTPDTKARGLVFIDAAGADSATAVSLGAGIVGTVNAVANSYNLLLGLDPTSADLAAIKNAGAFVLLVHEQPDATAATKFTMLTSADPLATNFMPFTPNLVTGLGTRTTLATDMAKITKVPLAASTNWALGGLGNPAKVATAPAGHVASFPRGFVGIDGAVAAPGGVIGEPVSFWTNDGAGADMALAMAANKPSVATELDGEALTAGVQGNGNTLSTITSASFVNGAVALAWSNDTAGTAGGLDHIDVLQSATAVVPKVGKGWSLVSVPTGGLTAATIDAVIKVGAQAASQYTWIKATDGAMPALTAGEAVFVFSNAGGNL